MPDPRDAASAGTSSRPATRTAGQRTGCPACGRELVVPKGPHVTGRRRCSRGVGGDQRQGDHQPGPGHPLVLLHVLHRPPGDHLRARWASPTSARARAGSAARGWRSPGSSWGASAASSWLLGPDRPAPARRPGRPRGRPPGPVHQQPQADRPGLAQLRRANGHFPPAAIIDAEGKPLLSWRVAILPYIEQEALYKQVQARRALGQPDQQAADRPDAPVYPCPSDAPGAAGMTRYQGIAGPGALFEGPQGPPVREITDGTSNTLLVVEAANPVPWTKPDDVDIAAIAAALGSKPSRRGNVAVRRRLGQVPQEDDQPGHPPGPGHPERRRDHRRGQLLIDDHGDRAIRGSASRGVGPRGTRVRAQSHFRIAPVWALVAIAAYLAR